MSLFRNMSLKGKLYSGFGFVIALVIFVSSIAFYNMWKAETIENRLDKLIGVEMRLTFELFNDYNKVHSWLHDLQVSPDPQLVEEGLSYTTTLEEKIDRLPLIEVSSLAMQTRQSVKDMCASILNTNFDTLLRSGKYKEADRVFISDVLPYSSQANKNFVALIIDNTKNITEIVHNLSSRSLMITTACIIFFGIVFSIVIATILYIYISKNTYLIKSCVNKLEEGVFKLDIDESHLSKDEIGDIYRSLISVSHTLNVAVARTIAIAKSLEEQSHNLSQASMAINGGASAASNNAISVAAAADEMVSTTADIAKNCHVAQETSEQTRQETYNGMDKVRSTVARIKEQAEYTKEDASKVVKLAEQSSRIGYIVGTIEEIAAQTNLLALNAAIEAARAGEAGRGFAVVADEVRALASRTSQSTKEISAMVASVRADSEAATASMNNSVIQMEDMAQSASALEDTFNTIVESVNNVNGQIIQIATAAEEQTTATAEISSNMQGITEAAQQAVDVSGNAADVANYCYSLTNTLLEELDFFTLDDDSLDRSMLKFDRVHDHDVGAGSIKPSEEA